MWLSNQIFELEQYSIIQSEMSGGDNGICQWVAGVSIQQISSIPQVEPIYLLRSRFPVWGV